jgi:UDP-glucose 4-epimerase
MRVLVTGGAGYLGSHTVTSLLDDGHDVLVVDDLSSGSEEALRRAAEVCGVTYPCARLSLVRADILEPDAYGSAAAEFAPDAAVHFAGLKSPAESLAEPERYYTVNVAGTAALAGVARSAGARAVLFSSSATVYGDEAPVPVSEDAPLAPVTPYGHSKAMAEQVLADVQAARPGLSVAALRYFNPVGAHPSGRLGEDPAGTPANLMPFVAGVACGRYAELQVFGDDYPTRDGSAVRDFIHVMDLAEAHVAALVWLVGKQQPVHRVWNIGRGTGVSVLEMVAAFERVTGRPVPYRLAPRRAGDIPDSCASVEAVARDLGWTASRDVDAMAADLWRWQEANPHGYRTA